MKTSSFSCAAKKLLPKKQKTHDKMISQDIKYLKSEYQHKHIQYTLQIKWYRLTRKINKDKQILQEEYNIIENNILESNIKQVEQSNDR